MGPLVASKIAVPRRRASWVARPRLRARLDRAAPLTLVSAPAGFGKTTLLTEWVTAAAAGGASYAWLSLDERDNEPTVFWTYVVTAVQQATGGTTGGLVGATALAVLESRQASVDVALTSLVNELQALDHELVIVLDDFHVITAKGIQEGMEFLLEFLPAQVHLVLASRTDPALPLARMRARGDLVEIRAERPAVHRRGGHGVPQRGDGAQPLRAGHRHPGGAHRGLDRGAAARGAVDAGPGRRRRLHRRLRRRTTATSSTTSPRRCWPAAGRRSGSSCSRPRSSTG